MGIALSFFPPILSYFPLLTSDCFLFVYRRKRNWLSAKVSFNFNNHSCGLVLKALQDLGFLFLLTFRELDLKPSCKSISILLSVVEELKGCSVGTLLFVLKKDDFIEGWTSFKNTLGAKNTVCIITFLRKQVFLLLVGWSVDDFCQPQKSLWLC